MKPANKPIAEIDDTITFELHGTIHVGSVKSIRPNRARYGKNGYTMEYQYRIVGIEPPLNGHDSMLMGEGIICVLRPKFADVKDAIQAAKRI